MNTENNTNPELLANLSVPSTVHGYSLGIEYIKNWFLSKFRKDFFKPESIYINGKHVFDDFRRFDNTKQLKRLKPNLVITPDIQLDFDGERVDLYTGGLDLFLKRSRWQNSFIRDSDKKLYLGFNLQQMTLNFNFRIRVSTRAQQLDIYRFMELAFRIGATQGVDLDLDFHIPYDLIFMFANDAGFVEDDKINNNFLIYLNKHSQVPILYKLRNINGKSEFFVRMSRMYTHISCLEKLSIDNGEREGMLDNNYTIEMNCILKMPVPQFYVYYTSVQHNEPIIYTENNAETIGIYTFKYSYIPTKNEKLWDLFLTTDYEDENTDIGIEIDIGELLEYKELRQVIDSNINSFISPAIFVDIKLFNEYKQIQCIIDWKNLKLIINENLPSKISTISIYVDLGYLNEQLIIIKNMKDNRLK
jgi:hypothetical protein